MKPSLLIAVLFAACAAQTQTFRVVPAHFVPAHLDETDQASAQKQAPMQHFACNTGYTPQECQAATALLRKALARYPVEALGDWRWVLVRTEDWKQILSERRVDPNVPAFSYLPKRETFLDGSLVVGASIHGAELRAIWRMPAEDLLDLAIRRELAHALCNEVDESKADRTAIALKNGTPLSCRVIEQAVPFQLIDGWAIVLDGTLGGLHHQKMLIDTGAVPSAISTRVTKRLHLAGSVQELSLMNRSIEVKSVRVPGVQLGPIAVETLDMVAMDLSRIELALDTRIDAVIGLDLLARRNFTLDYRYKKLVFASETEAAGAIAFQMKHEAGGTYILIPLSSGGEELQVLLDTGTKDLMLFHRRLAGRLKQLHIQGQDFNLNVGGKDTVAEIEMPSVNVGPVSRHKQKAYLWTPPDRNLRNFDGLLGPTALGATKVAFDFDRQVVSFETR